MELRTDSKNYGESKVFLRVPENCPPANYELILNNSLGLAAIPITVTSKQNNSAPVTNDDDFTIEYGASSYNLDIFAANGHGRDRDIDSDEVSVTFAYNGLGKLRYNSKTMGVTYSLPSKLPPIQGAFTDSFIYTVSDGQASSSATVTVTLNPIVVTSVRTWSKNIIGILSPASKIIITGKHFGLTTPDVGIVYNDASGQKIQKLKVVSQPHFANYAGRE
jgi:hypothetical protein